MQSHAHVVQALVFCVAVRGACTLTSSTAGPCACMHGMSWIRGMRSPTHAHAPAPQDDSALTEKLEEERVRVATLQCQAAALQQEKLELERRLLTTKLETEAQLAAYQTQLEQLKYKVTAVINKLLSKAIDESEATKELEELGCHVDYV